MEISFFCESRDYLRVKANVPVRFRFSGERLEDSALEQEYEGVSRDLSGGGLLLRGPIPDDSWIPDLLMERITIVVQVFLPDAHEPVRARARVAWIDTGKGARNANAPSVASNEPAEHDEHETGHEPHAQHAEHPEATLDQDAPSHGSTTGHASHGAPVESATEYDDGHASLGLKFVQIAREDQDRLFQYILEDLLP